jgi:hypothetical protein
MVGGGFATAGGKVSAYWARWGPVVATLKQPGTRFCLPGDRISQSVKATATGPLAYQWRRGGVPLANGGTISGCDTDTLTIQPAAAADAGTYDVLITGQTGSVTSDSATLKATFIPDINRDGLVDVVDLLWLVSSFGAASGDAHYNPACDLDGDGSVDVADLLLMVEDWGRSVQS